mmetsp:Transcript_28019/g.66868  ORF Transcript_28019/g.66868 Transcript_28019/m.66868 type:complete len:289 (-) Transcript_28019:1618-2484(-)
MAVVPHEEFEEEDDRPAVEPEMDRPAEGAPNEPFPIPQIRGRLRDVDRLQQRRISGVEARVALHGVDDAPPRPARELPRRLVYHHSHLGVSRLVGDCHLDLPEAEPAFGARRERVEIVHLGEITVGAVALVQVDVGVLQALRDHAPDHCDHREARHPRAANLHRRVRHRVRVHHSLPEVEPDRAPDERQASRLEDAPNCQLEVGADRPADCLCDWVLFHDELAGHVQPRVDPNAREREAIAPLPAPRVPLHLRVLQEFFARDLHPGQPLLVVVVRPAFFLFFIVIVQF